MHMVHKDLGQNRARERGQHGQRSKEGSRYPCPIRVCEVLGFVLRGRGRIQRLVSSTLPPDAQVRLRSVQRTYRPVLI